MHPRLYPFVVNGPTCACTHRRVVHVGTNKYGLPQADLGCSECDLCEQFTPLEAVDHEAEGRLLDEIREDEARRRRLHTKVVYGVLVGLLVALPAIAFAPQLFPWVMIPVLGAGVVNMLVTTWDGWLRGDLDTKEASMQAAAALAVALFFLALAMDVPTIILAVAVALVLMLTIGLMMTIRDHMERSRRSLRAIATDLKNQEDDTP